MRLIFNMRTGVIEQHPDLPEEAESTPDRHRADVLRYTARARVKDLLIAEMAADNMARVRAGTWTVQNLIGLMSDPQV